VLIITFTICAFLSLIVELTICDTSSSVLIITSPETFDKLVRDTVGAVELVVGIAI
jgi:hypothetical protein